MGKKTMMMRSPSPTDVCCSHLILVLGLIAAFWLAQYVYLIDLVSHPSQTLRLLFAIEAPIVILVYSRFRRNPEQCSYLKAVGRGLLAIPAGAVVSALGAIVLGAPVGFQYLPLTANWSFLMSILSIVPAASVFGLSWADWHRIFALTKPVGPVDHMICLPAHGAVIGAWLGAWPMPLDWEQPWQEWPICVTFGAVIGYTIATIVSITLALVRSRQQHVKRN